MRVTRLNSLGQWVTGATGSAVSKGFIKIDLKDNIDAGQEFKVKNASGEQCINQKDRDILNWIDVSIDWCKVDPELTELVTGSRILTGRSGETVGFTKANVSVVPQFALEVWSKIAGTAQGSYQYMYWLMPFLTNGWFGDITLEDGAATFNMKANTQDNANWGLGPYNVIGVDVNNTPGKLTQAVLAGEHLYWRSTEVAPPSDVCGYVAQNVAWVTPPVGP